LASAQPGDRATEAIGSAWEVHLLLVSFSKLVAYALQLVTDQPLRCSLTWQMAPGVFEKFADYAGMATDGRGLRQSRNLRICGNPFTLLINCYC
jgi:hypothetical protein